MQPIEIGTLEIGEVHPAAHSAYRWIKEYTVKNAMRMHRLIEAFASTAISGNRTGDVCGETLRRIIQGEPVSDRYILGLAWTLKTMDEIKDGSIRRTTKKRMPKGKGL